MNFGRGLGGNCILDERKRIWEEEEGGEDGSFDGKMKFNPRCLIFTCKCTCNFEDSFFYIYFWNCGIINYSNII